MKRALISNMMLEEMLPEDIMKTFEFSVSEGWEPLSDVFTDFENYTYVPDGPLEKGIHFYDLKDRKNYEVFGPASSLENTNEKIVIMRSVLGGNVGGKNFPPGSVFFKSVMDFDERIKLTEDTTLGGKYYHAGDEVRRFMEVVPAWRKDLR